MQDQQCDEPTQVNVRVPGSFTYLLAVDWKITDLRWTK